MSDLSNSDGSVGESGDWDGVGDGDGDGDGNEGAGGGGWSSGGFDPPILYVRFRFALTGGRSGITCDALTVLGGTLRTVKCERERVYGESVWFEWESVDSWDMVLFSAGRRMTGSVEGGELELQLSKWRFMLDVEETERRRLERDDLRGVSMGATDEGGVSIRPLLDENWVSRLSGVTGRGGRAWLIISYVGSDRVYWRGSA